MLFSIPFLSRVTNMNDGIDPRVVVRKHALLNAAKHNGVAQVGSVMSSIMGEHAALRPRAKEIKPIVEEEVTSVNRMGMEAIQAALTLDGIDPSMLGQGRKEEKGLPPLPGLSEGMKPVFRLAPYPSGPLHIGNARMVVLNDEYAKASDGRLVLCFDDTIGATKKKIDEEDSGAKFVVPEGYDLIREGLRWLGVRWHEECYKSDRLPIYHEHCVRLIESGHAYACDCQPAAFKALKDRRQPCPHRTRNVQENMAEWRKMLDGECPEGSVVIRLKTGVDLSDPALREPVIMRISMAEHPRVGTKYSVWPMLEFSWAIDDHLLGITHIIRGKDLFKEDYIEQFIWDLLGWERKNILHYGIISFKGLKLSKTHAREEIQRGTYIGWDDPRTWSLQSLARRGFQPDALRAALLSMGLSMTDIDFPYSMLYAENQKRIDPVSDRFFFVEDPVEMQVHGLPWPAKIAEPLVNPLTPSRGTRTIPVPVNDGRVMVLLSARDHERIASMKGNLLIRLKDLVNVTVQDGDVRSARYHSEDLDQARENKAMIIHWVDANPANNVDIEVFMPDGTMMKGKGESNLRRVKQGQTLQFERFGFVCVDRIIEGKVFTWLSH